MPDGFGQYTSIDVAQSVEITDLCNGQRSQDLGRSRPLQGVHPVHFDTGTLNCESVNDSTWDWLKEHRAVQVGDRAILSKEDYENVQGGTNTLKVLEVV